ncbi:trifunctional formate-tetrahydrofolate ligase/methenyltetrahydrofolate cyclohydrolase/methylenetetrahydrofolate dehydrogenase [Saccharomycopsis crataegensis]|uniref:Trifunctional formate-tetrahydrofolate ligase/methenyltetrahydrofolate cyclohydrolase/methylenetetrahydrofolate dehydrogenase n=1 Tax=Saccharomycopsis crataegensis TaxID=43959 RepID=A0AAV5QVI4_9ASCO|nr:trifunctional formate-tetrahydrofolate ligase/methenyltetrahydrofolate cyclohydrolase/methylenetetrahydrofolate dehydrogenase [Saccharomycopsis crataegensis]
MLRVSRTLNKPALSSRLQAVATRALRQGFATNRPNLQAEILSGKELAKKIKVQAANEVTKIQAVNPSFQPNLAIIQVGDKPDSSTYVRMKLKAAKESKINSSLIKLPGDISENDLLFKINQLNNDINVHGILVQLPLPKHLDEARITNSVSDSKDVDGFNRYNVGELYKRAGSPTFIPCTPNGIIELLKASNLDLKGKSAVVIGRSDIVGTPVFSLLNRMNATVTLCHSKTKNVEDIISRSDVVIAALGKPNFVKGEWLKPGAIVIDVGINYIPDATKKSGQKLVGDVDFESAKHVAKLITPVPGGVGPMTVAMLISNVLKGAKAQEMNKFHPVTSSKLPLHLIKPVPSDIDISRAQHPRNITNVARDLGIKESEFEQYGAYKGKVSLDVYKRLADQRVDGHYILVAGITPTPLGEGKSTTTIGLVQALGAHLNKPTIANVRQPSMGPTFGVKGGAAGGGYSQVIPMDEFNMHLTGDIHAIGAANNLLAAAIDTRIFHEMTQKSDKTFYNRLVPKKKGGRSFTKSMLLRLKKLGINKTNPDDLTAEEISKFARLNINPDTVSIKRVVDVNDRFVREVTIGQAATEKNFNRKTGFDITVASELMAILALSNDLKDLRSRVGRIVVAMNTNNEPITCDDIGCGGAITALLKDAIKPTLMQTLEGQPVLVHAGPFANISIGASSVIADKLALKLLGTPKHMDVVKKELGSLLPEGTDPNESYNKYIPEKGYVVTEAGFDFTMGGERFFNIKCRSSGLKPNVVVIVATTRALKLHGGGPDVKPGQTLPMEYQTQNLDLVAKGCENLAKQISNAKSFGSPVVVAINQFNTDTPEEIAVIKQKALEAGAADAVESNHWEEGGKGAIKLAESVVKIADSVETAHEKVNFLYDASNPSIAEKLETISKEMYGADGIELSELAKEQIKSFESNNLNKLPICIAKTQYSLSHDPALKGVPSGFKIPIREIKASVGAGYLYALAGKIMTIPGLPTHSGFMNVEVDEETGEIDGLF